MALEIWDVLLTLLGIVILLLLYGRWVDGSFRRRGVKSVSAPLPFLGHMWGVVSQKEHFKDFVKRIYTAYPNERYSGIRQFLQPLIVVRDLELLKQLTIKEFDHFADHISNVEESGDQLFGNNLFSLKGQKWRDMRATLSPAFTSSKMRGMFDFVAECGEQMADFYIKEMEKPENRDRGLIEVEMKDAFTRYTNDVIATAAFGLKVNSLQERDNEFYLMGKSASDFSGFRFLKFFLVQSLPRFCKLFKIQLFSEDMERFFRNLVLGTMKQREEKNIVRADMIQLLMEARKGVLKHDQGENEGKEAGFATVEESTLGKQTIRRKWTDIDIVAQAMLFFVAGFDTSAVLLCFLTYELTNYPDVQKRLQEEIDEVAEKNNGRVNYNDLQNMKYMDMVVSETLRLWPPGVAIDRKCVKPFTLPPPNDSSDTKFEMKVGDAIWVPIYAIHHDPKYFKNPALFDPERFSDDNKAKINPFSYMPFGVGPRNCIGSRFALMEAKAVIFYLLHKFDLVPTAKTQIPIQLKKNTFTMQSENGFWMGLKPRVRNT